MNSTYRFLEYFADRLSFISNLIAQGSLTSGKLSQALVEFADFLPSEIEEIKEEIDNFVKDSNG
jgi:hypothetical protein